MYKLTIFNTDVIPVYETEDGKKVVIGRELHERLALSERYSKWFERMAGYGFIEGKDYTPYQMVHPQNKQEIETHIMSLDMAKHIAMIQRSKEGFSIRQKLIELEDNISELSPQTQALINIELRQNRQARELREVKEEVQAVRDIIELSPNGWREDARKMIVRIAQKMGGNEYIKDINSEIYKLLNERFGVDLGIRLTNMRRRMAEEDTSKSKRDKTTKVDVIAADKKLIEGYLIIIKEMAIKYGVTEVA